MLLELKEFQELAIQHPERSSSSPKRSIISGWLIPTIGLLLFGDVLGNGEWKKD